MVWCCCTEYVCWRGVAAGPEGARERHRAAAAGAAGRARRGAGRQLPAGAARRAGPAPRAQGAVLTLRLLRAQPARPRRRYYYCWYCY